MANSRQKQGNYEVGYGKPPAHSRFQKGKSGNLGGLPKGTPKISAAYARLLTLSPEELRTFQPSNVAEELALEQIRTAQAGKPSETLRAIKEVTGRTEGKARQPLELKNTSELERLIIRVQERVWASTGREVTREEAIERIVAYRPEFASVLA
jgi:hypothetical protein